MKLSIVTTLYRSAAYIEEFYRRISDTARQITDEYEILFVNDGSPDKSLDIAIGLAGRDEKASVIDLSRNFGHHRAIMTGLRHAKGGLVFLMDIDLEEDPELLLDFYHAWEAEGGAVDVVYGIQERREGGLFRKWAGEAFYRIYNLLSSEKIPVNLSMTRLMTRRYVKSLLRHREHEIILSGLFELTGFIQRPLLVQKRFKGETSYHFFRRLAMFINSIASFSHLPLILIWWVGLAITLSASGFTIWLLYLKIRHNIGIEGWVGIMVSVWFFSGIIIFFIGVIGLYISKIFIESKRRPVSIVRKVYGLKANNREKPLPKAERDV